MSIPAKVAEGEMPYGHYLHLKYIQQPTFEKSSYVWIYKFTYLSKDLSREFLGCNSSPTVKIYLKSKYNKCIWFSLDIIVTVYHIRVTNS